jgi:hypothetical protein
MNSPYAPCLKRHHVLAASLITALISITMGVFNISGTAQVGPQEREFKNTVPAHVPIKVKLRNEQKFKDLNNNNWARDLEIEVKNTGPKPIYYIYAIVLMNDYLLEDGNPLSFRVKYGRKELFDLAAPLQPDDVPIRPGESIVFRIDEARANAYAVNRARRNRPEPKSISFEMQLINFGDGTGLESTQGVAIPEQRRRVSSTVPAAKQRGEPGQSLPKDRGTTWLHSALNPS